MKIDLDDVAQFVRAIPLAVVRAAYGDYVRTRINGMPFFVDARDNIVSFDILFRRRWEPAESAFFRSMIRPGDRIVDIGGHIGYYSVLFGACAGPGGRVLTLEPNADNAALARRNVALNDFTGRVQIIEAAAGAQRGRADLFLADSQNRGDHRMYAPSAGRSTAQVEVVVLDDILNAWDRVDLVKMDVQGFEPHALAGMQATLERNDGIVFVSEFWPHGMQLAGGSAPEYLSRLRGLGFRFFVLTGNGKLERTDARALLQRYQAPKRFTDIVCARDGAIAGRLASSIA